MKVQGVQRFRVNHPWLAADRDAAGAVHEVDWRPCLPAALRRRGSALLNLQFWLWGQDIRHPSGNLLIRAGFRRERPPNGAAGGRRYEAAVEGGHTVTLWGFGLAFAGSSGCVLYLSRFHLSPMLLDADAAPPEVWSPQQLPARFQPGSPEEWKTAGALLVEALHWIGQYERWVADELGSMARIAMAAEPPSSARACPGLQHSWHRMGWTAQSWLDRSARAVQVCSDTCMDDVDVPTGSSGCLIA